MGNSSCSLTLQSVNVPVFHGFAAALQISFDKAVDLESCRRSLAGLEAMTVSDSVVTPISDCNQSFGCAISHLQQNSNQGPNLQFWLVADPMRYGLANNYVNVLDFLLKSFL
jgi:aspartate-semialdehyde dehydrogenase